MATPSITDLFGAGATWDANNNQLKIPFSALQAAGLSTNPPSALEVYSALVKNAHTWLNANTDQSVMASSDLTVQAPLTRNGTPKTQYQFATRFFGSYQAPEFDPDQV